MKTCFLAAAACLVPALAWAVPPREQAKRPQPGPMRPAARQQPAGGTPSLSPTARPATAINRPGRPANQTGGGPKPNPSILPSAPSPSIIGNRPGQGGSGRPPMPNTQPDIVRPTPPIRPTTPIARPERPGTRPAHDLRQYERPSLPYNRPDVVINRPDININRPTVINNSVVNNTVINQNNIVNQNFGNQQVNNYRPRPYYSQLHNHWQPASWSAAYRPAYYNYSYSSTSGGWLGAATATYVFVNPFFARPASTSTVAVRYDYSQPIRVPPPNYQETDDDLVRSERAIRRFDDAREVFRRGEYGRASELIDEAIDLLPSDPSLHQFRSLVLFARQRYPDSAAALYNVLAVSPGWTRETLAKLYDTPERYLTQVDALEKYAAATPEAIDARFLLAYHYLMIGNIAGATRQLEIVKSAKPGDRVVESLITGLAQAAAGQSPG